jgi:hypothetical protein
VVRTNHIHLVPGSEDASRPKAGARSCGPARPRPAAVQKSRLSANSLAPARSRGVTFGVRYDRNSPRKTGSSAMPASALRADPRQPASAVGPLRRTMSSGARLFQRQHKLLPRQNYAFLHMSFASMLLRILYIIKARKPRGLSSYLTRLSQRRGTAGRMFVTCTWKRATSLRRRDSAPRWARLPSPSRRAAPRAQPRRSGPLAAFSV